MRFGSKQAMGLWQRLFREASEPARRIRLGLLALRLAPWLREQAFEPLIEAERGLFNQMGRAGRAIAAESPAIPKRIAVLLRRHHPALTRWAVRYAQHEAQSEHRPPILKTVLRTAANAEAQLSARRIDGLARAVKVLHERHSDAAAVVLTRLLKTKRDRPRLIQSVLLGLLRCRDNAAGRVLRGMESFTNLAADNLAVLLRARSGLKLKPAQRATLRTIVQGGGSLQPLVARPSRVAASEANGPGASIRLTSKRTAPVSIRLN
jgi:hypothetical protein